MAVNNVRVGEFIASFPAKSTDGQNVNPKASPKQPAENVEIFSQEELAPVIETINGFMSNLNADIRFQLHDKTQRLMVQVVDVSNDQILREFPPHQLLDTLAKISDYVGALLDKRV